MNERPTPETDARTYIPSLGASTVPADFARRLERERDEAREAFVIATDQMVQAQCKTREALRERDEARAERALADRLAIEADKRFVEVVRELRAERALADRLAKAVQNHFGLDGDMLAAQAELDNTSNRLESALAAWKEARND